MVRPLRGSTAWAGSKSRSHIPKPEEESTTQPRVRIQRSDVEYQPGGKFME